MYKDSSLYKELKRLCKVINEQGSISYGDIAFLQQYQTEIKEWFPDELELQQWAGIEEE